MLRKDLTCTRVKKTLEPLPYYFGILSHRSISWNKLQLPAKL
jgi:hypothetical protein